MLIRRPLVILQPLLLLFCSLCWDQLVFKNLLVIDVLEVYHIIGNQWFAKKVHFVFASFNESTLYSFIL